MPSSLHSPVHSSLPSSASSNRAHSSKQDTQQQDTQQYAQPAAQQQPYAQPAAQQQPRSRWSTRRKVFTFGGIGLGVIALAVVAILVIPLFFRGSSSGSTLVPLRTYASAVEEGWSYDFDTPDYVTQSSLYNVGDAQLLTFQNFDYSTWASDNMSSSSFTWYDGFADDYEAGYTAGESYNDAYDQWLDDFDADYPDPEDYWPSEAGDYYSADYDSGYMAGWYDSQYGTYGDNLAEEPPTIDTALTATLIDANASSADSGVVWTVTLTDILSDFDYSTTSFYPVSIDSTYVVIEAISATYDDDYNVSYATTFVVVPKSDASAAKTITMEDGQGVSAATAVGSRLVVHNADEDNPELVAYDLDSASSTPVWTVEAAYDYSVLTGPNDTIVFANTNGDATAVALSDGSETSWASALPDSVSVISEVASGVIAAYSSDDDETVAFSADGSELWTADGYALYSDGTRLYSAEESGSAYTLSALNPSSGEELWTSTEDFSSFLGAIGNRIVVSNEDDELVVLNASNGEVQENQLPSVSVDDAVNSFLGTSQVIIETDGELVAYAFGDTKQQWSSSLDDDWDVSQVGDRLVATVTDSSTYSVESFVALDSK